LNKRRFWVCATLVLIPVLFFAVSERMGWPFLIGPLTKQAERSTGLVLRLQASPDTDVAKPALHFWGGLRLQSPLLEIDAPPWSQKPYLLKATDLDLRLRYGDIWQAYGSASRSTSATVSPAMPLVVQALSASSLSVFLERMADGRTSWQLPASDKPTPLPHVQSLEVQQGQMRYEDSLMALQLEAQLSLSHGQLRVSTQGHFRQDAFSGTLVSTGALPWEREGAHAAPAAIKLGASVGRVSLDFDGTAQDFLHLNGLDGNFRVQGPSLAAIGEPLRVTLPTTLAVQANGRLQRNGTRWSVALHSARVGTSQLGGDFVFDTAATPPRLSGALNGALLKLADLGPAVGVSAAASTCAGRAKVLPTRDFNLVSLRSMDADVNIAIDRLDANTALLESVRPLRAHLQLTGGLLTLTDIDARTAQGHLGGTIALDGQRNIANWVAALNWDGVQLQSWIHQQRAAGLPPYVSGRLKGHAVLLGQGRSTAEILATLQGDIGATVDHGTLSHLLVEAGGLDVAEALGVYFKGDNALALNCAVADIRVSAGLLRPRLLVLDTEDSTVWVDGTLSLATEKLDLRVVVAPKDFTVLALRSPFHVTGTFAKPSVQVERGPLGVKLGAAFLLGLVNPVAALLPLMDTGDKQGARASDLRCLQHR
jgi:uncharacterized protein involved in outer membrane biogenesis